MEATVYVGIARILRSPLPSLEDCVIRLTFDHEVHDVFLRGPSFETADL